MYETVLHHKPNLAMLSYTNTHV